MEFLELLDQLHKSVKDKHAVSSKDRNFRSYHAIDFVGNSESFMLTVSGESMINAGIFHGDLVLVEKANTAKNSDIVVALIEDSATVKTFYKENGHIRLQPENDSMEPIIVEGDMSILGKVIGLFRTF